MRRQRRSASQGASGAWTSDAVAARLESKLVGLNLVELQHRGVKLLSAFGLALVVVGPQRILKIQASLTAHWHDKGADWRGLAHTPAHHRSRLSDSVKNGNALRTMHNAALPAR